MTCQRGPCGNLATSTVYSLISPIGALAGWIPLSHDSRGTFMDSQKNKEPGSPTGKTVKSGSPAVKPRIPTTQVVDQAEAKVQTASAIVQSQTSTRPQAESKYTKLMDETSNYLEILSSSSVVAAPNTKLEVKNNIKILGKCFRDLTRVSKVIGLTRSPDALEQCLRALQQQNQQQYLKMMELIKETREENKQLRVDLQQIQLQSLKPLNQNTDERPDAMSQELLESRNATESKLEKLTTEVADVRKVIYNQFVPGQSGVTTNITPLQLEERDEILKTRSEPDKNRKTRTRIRPDALIIKTNESRSYRDVLKSLRRSEKIAELGEHVRTIKNQDPGTS